MMMFDKDLFFTALKPKVESVDLPGFGSLNLRELTTVEVEETRKKIQTNPADDFFGLELLSLSLVDEEGNAALSPEDVEQLKKSSHKAIDTLVSKTLEINGFSRDTVEKKDTTPTGVSATV
jgi:hypothetical protein